MQKSSQSSLLVLVFVAMAFFIACVLVFQGGLPQIIDYLVNAGAGTVAVGAWIFTVGTADTGLVMFYPRSATGAGPGDLVRFTLTE